MDTSESTSSSTTSGTISTTTSKSESSSTSASIEMVSSSSAPSTHPTSSSSISQSINATSPTPVPATTADGSGPPGWAIAMFSLLGLLLLIGLIIVCYCWAHHRRRQRHGTGGSTGPEKSKYRRLGSNVSNATTASASTTQKSAKDSSKDGVSAAKSPMQRIRTIESTTAAGSSPVLPGKRLATMRKNKKQIAIDNKLSRIFSASGRAVGKNQESGKSSMDNSNSEGSGGGGSGPEKNASAIKTVHSFVLGKKKHGGGSDAKKTTKSPPSPASKSKSPKSGKAKPTETGKTISVIGKQGGGDGSHEGSAGGSTQSSLSGGELDRAQPTTNLTTSGLGAGTISTATMSASRSDRIPGIKKSGKGSPKKPIVVKKKK